jgi:hypothetical protein
VKPSLEIVETVVMSNEPFEIDGIFWGYRASRPPGEAWTLIEYLISEKATRWTRRKPVRLNQENHDERQDR